MTTVQINLPEQIAQEAEKAGLLTSEQLEALLRERLRGERLKRLKAARDQLATQPLPPMTAEEIQAEIRAYRAGQRRAAGT